MAHEPGAAHLQPVAGVSARWRSDSAVTTLVRDWPGTELDGRIESGIGRCCRGDCSRDLGAVGLVGGAGGVHWDELLERVATGTRFDAAGEDTPARRIRVSVVPLGAAPGGGLALLEVRCRIRYV